MLSKVGELEADLEFLMRAAFKVETIREDLGKVGPVIASQVEEAMLGKRTKLDTARTLRKSAGTLCTVPGEIAFLAMEFILHGYTIGFGE